MTAVDQVDRLIEQYQLALDEFMKGTPNPCRNSSPRQKTEPRQPTWTSRAWVG